MTKEELKKEANKYAKGITEKYVFMEHGRASALGYLAGAEPREKRIAELEKENAELRAIAENQQSSNMERYFKITELREGLGVASVLNKSLNAMNKQLEEERDKYRNMVFDQTEQLTKAKELLKRYVPYRQITDSKAYKDLAEETEQFLNSEVEK